jgi:hypothetical protein
MAAVTAKRSSVNRNFAIDLSLRGMEMAQRVTELKNELAALMMDAPQVLAMIRGTEFRIAPLKASSKVDGS